MINVVCHAASRQIQAIWGHLSETCIRWKAKEEAEHEINFNADAQLFLQLKLMSQGTKRKKNQPQETPINP